MLAWFLFVAEIGNGQVELWQIMAHIGLIGLMAVAVFTSHRMKLMHQRGANQLIILTILFIFLGFEEIITSHTNFRFLTNFNIFFDNWKYSKLINVLYTIFNRDGEPLIRGSRNYPPLTFH